ncbi:Gfo/Idh/MocA family protein [Legionella waltersii]|uniref:Myo-inositol-2-dehydrogenase n=1 Tax=Legionella waltersii TaxID=66969 RepID=A0A0W1AN56_9GAMM|nr:Gfo/Idh/MocA family oxidoreductase [Legionella waltersii]KTD82758.1 myo-inositol-2-dehydrogenase [Legionella waltersii]SNV01135.1 myo-inositol 2-dehydrogenase [Legionella waltersii]
MNLDHLNVGVIGIGRMGQRHIEAIQKMGAAISGIVDISTAALEETSKKFGISPNVCFTDAKEMIRSTKPNAIVIATTAPTHANFTILAAQNQVKYILCEKPMAISLNEVTAMEEACNHYGSVLAINHQMMFLPQYTEIKRIINSNEFGPLSSINVCGSNFGLAMNGSHYFEMFRYLTDQEIISVQAWFEEEKVPNPRGAQFEDYSGSLLVKNKTGTKMYIDFSSQSGHGLQVIYLFKYGQVLVDELSGFVRTICRKPEFKELPTTRYGMPAEENAYTIQPCELIDSTIKVWDAMIANKEFPNTNVGLNSMRCLVAAVESHENNHSEIFTNRLTTDTSREFKWA